MTTKDIDSVSIVDNSCFNIPWSKDAFYNELDNPLAIYVVAKIRQKVVGYVGMWKVLDEGQITNIAVLPDYRRNGIGDALLWHLFLYSKNNGIISLTLEVRKNNLIAQSFYKKQGFCVEGERKKYYEDTGEDALIMWKHLA
jgi:ribosomal-protein-alanine N-acetyltransferase